MKTIISSDDYIQRLLQEQKGLIRLYNCTDITNSISLSIFYFRNTGQYSLHFHGTYIDTWTIVNNLVKLSDGLGGGYSYFCTSKLSIKCLDAMIGCQLQRGNGKPNPTVQYLRMLENNGWQHPVIADHVCPNILSLK